MLDQILAAIYPDRLPNARVRAALAVALLLSPLALAAGFLLVLKGTPPSPVQTTIDRAGEIGIAKNFLAHEGIATEGWAVSTGYNNDNDLLEFVNAERERQILWRVAPPFYGTVTFHSNQQTTAAVSVSVDGRILDFALPERPAERSALTDEEALRLASVRLPSGLGFGNPSLETNLKSGERVYTFRSASVPGAEVTATVTVSGRRVRNLEVKAAPAETATQGISQGIQSALSAAGIVFICLVVLFSIYRYASRTLQQEVSHRRSLIVAGLCGCFCILLALNAVVNGQTGPTSTVIIILVFVVMFLVGGAVMAAAYASGEGDIREAWPGKLTSLDALLSGRFLSRNIGVSVIFGAACTGWLVLVLGAVTLPFYTSVPQGSIGLEGPLMRWAWVMPVITYPLVALATMAAGLLQPLAFVTLYLQRARRWHVPIVMLCAVLVFMARQHQHSALQFLITSCVFAAALLVPFYLVDLLATLVCVSAITALISLAGSCSLASRLSGSSLALHAGCGLAMVVFALVCLKWGRAYREEEVRPLYARHIVQRQALESEVSAARQAQLRLLPERPPSIEGLHVAAACVPAEIVGGDFYDFFALGNGRLGVFIAEGNNRGIAAAMTIALAKGYLMHCVERFQEPVEILARLEAALRPMFKQEFRAEFNEEPKAELEAEELGAEFAFAAIDTETGEVRYARTSDYPKVVVVSKGEAAERLEVVRGRSNPIVAGRAILAEGDQVLLFTDGMGRRLAKRNRKADENAARLATRSSVAQSKRQENQKHNPAEEVRDLLFRATKTKEDPDDLTLVVIMLGALAGRTSVSTKSDTALGRTA